MTVRELKEKLEEFNDDLIVEVAHDEAQNVYEDEIEYWDNYDDWKSGKSPKKRTVVVISNRR